MNQLGKLEEHADTIAKDMEAEGAAVRLVLTMTSPLSAPPEADTPKPRGY